MTLTLYNALDIFEENIEDIKLACMENIRAILTEEGSGNWIRQEITRLRVLPYHSMLKRITARQQSKVSVRSSSITDAMIAHAKEFPIEGLYDGRLRKGVGLCPFHDEGTPSFSIKYNKYRCFGCDAHGDAIDFYMKTNNCNFVTAVKAMQ